jgi:hypothetical protein
MKNRTNCWHLVLVSSVCCALAGCTTPDSRLEIRLADDLTSSVDYPTCYFQEMSNNDVFVVGNTLSGDAESGASEWIELRIYWRPRPGKTAANASMTNALVTYAVQVGDGLTVYRGTGFVSIGKRKNSDQLIFDLRRADFEAPITLGKAPLDKRMRIKGTLLASEDSQSVSRLRRELSELIAPAIPIGT